MTKQEMIEILRTRTVRATLNHCVDKYGSTIHIKKGRPLFLSRDKLTEILINEIENLIKYEQPKQAENSIIDFYTDMLSPESTGENVRLNTVTLSDTGVNIIEDYFNKLIDELIKARESTIRGASNDI